MTSHDQARQFAKTYMAALNTGEEQFAALFAGDAEVRLRGQPATPARVRGATLPGRSAYRGARVEAPGFLVLIRVRPGGTVVEERQHRVELRPDGQIGSLSA